MESDEKSIRNRLVEIRDQLSAADSERERLRAERDELIRLAVSAGLTRREIARLSGTSHQRITQVVNDR